MAQSDLDILMPVTFVADHESHPENAPETVKTEPAGPPDSSGECHSPRFNNLVIDAEVVDRWRGVGTTEGLDTDTDIACFLLDQYEQMAGGSCSSAQCPVCQSPLTCDTCKPPAMAASKQTKSSEMRTSSLVRSKNTRSKQKDCTAVRVVKGFGVRRGKKHTSNGSRVSDVGKDVFGEISNVKGTGINPLRPRGPCGPRPTGTSGPQRVNSKSSEYESKNSALLKTSSAEVIAFQNRIDGTECVERPSVEIPSSHSENDKTSLCNGKKYECRADEKTGSPLSDRSSTHIEDLSDQDKPAEMEDSSEYLRSNPKRLMAKRKRKISPVKIAIDKKDTLTCRICNKSFSTAKLLQKHVKDTHKKGKHYQCPECDKMFVSKNYLECIHMIEHKAVDPALRKDGVCGQCGKYVKHLALHEERHTLDRKYKCTVCHKSYKTKDCLRQHMESHSEERRWKCQYCEKAFKTQVNLYGHVATHRKFEKEWEHKCAICGSRHVTRYKLAIHMRTHTGYKPCVCHICAKAFTTNYCLNMHIKTRHSSEKPFVCQECGQAFAVSVALKAHMRRHSESKMAQEGQSAQLAHNLEQLLCQLCGMAFKRKQSLADHLKGHADARNYRCDECEKGFNTYSSLRQHKLQVHIGREKRYKCSKCERKFMSPAELQSHDRMHSGIKPFACSLCSKTFASQLLLNKHVKRHEDTKPYVCEVCSSRFRQPHCLKVHMKKHTGEKPHQCRYCGEAFSWTSGLRWHLRKGGPCWEARNEVLE